jgi:hypothetical protein
MHHQFHIPGTQLRVLGAQLGPNKAWKNRFPNELAAQAGLPYLQREVQNQADHGEDHQPQAVQ